MARIKATMKIYPINQENKEHWSETQEMRLVTVRITEGTDDNGKPSEGIANKAFGILHALGYGALDYNTHVKEIKAKYLHLEQAKLLKEFELRLVK
ncbi:MAG: hypothetical protein ACW96U_00840 [Candidatus Heimdallarchaeaceae archaeon]|jgi:hypothetical protein